MLDADLFPCLATGTPAAEITIEDICDEFEIRRTKLYEISNHSFGMGISEHIRRMRVKVACDLLRNTEDRVSDIATEVGIPDYNYFTKVFKKSDGCYTKRI